MIKVNKYEVQTVEHFDHNGNSLGFLNEQENLPKIYTILHKSTS
jgi:hypothetical protein